MRALVIGSCGAGKTTFGRKLAAKWAVPFVELDGIYHLPGWASLPDDQFRAKVEDLVVADAWVVDGNYGVVRSLVMDWADVVIWLDYARWRVMSRVLRRSVARAVTRQPV